jgi:CRISPR type III-A-associated protein Csm2
MALALAPELDTPLGSVYGRSRDRLEIAKSADKDCFFLLGRTLEWKQLSDAAELKDELTAMVREFGVAPQYLSRPVRNLSRDPPRARRQTRGASLAFPSAAAADPRGRLALARFPEGPRQPDRGPGGQESREPEIASVGPRSARMGQAVDRRPVRDLTYNTRFGWLIRADRARSTHSRKPSRPAEAQAPQAERPERKPAPQGGSRARKVNVRKGLGAGPLLKDNAAKVGGGQGERAIGRGPHGGREGGREGGRDRGDDRRGDRPRFEGPPEIDIEKLISDPLVSRQPGPRRGQPHARHGLRHQEPIAPSLQRRSPRRPAPENERQQQFVMLRARLAYTIARHSLRSLDSLEKLLLQVTRKNEARGYERFRDLFEAIVAYNE